jgi:hypothetical protein
MQDVHGAHLCGWGEAGYCALLCSCTVTSCCGHAEPSPWILGRVRSSPTMVGRVQSSKKKCMFKIFAISPRVLFYTVLFNLSLFFLSFQKKIRIRY